MEGPDDPDRAGRRELEAPTRLSRSLLWRLQRASYQAQGPLAWRPGGVPLQITSNPFIAACYAQVIAALVRDLDRSAAPPARPIDIIELGAGSGRFGYFLLRALSAVFGPDGGGRPRFRLIMTDLAERNLTAWAEHPRLAPYTERGVLDVARFDAEWPAPLKLRISGEVLAPDPAGQPVVAIANYFFDSIPCDAYRVDDGALRECLVALDGIGDADSALLDPAAAIDRLSWRIEDGPAKLDHDDRLIDDVCRALAREHHKAGDRTAWLLPVAGCAVIDYLARLGGGKLLLLSSDKGHREPALRSPDDLTIVRHGGCVSLSVDYHALARYVERRGGLAVPREQRHPAFYSGVLALGLASESLPHCLAAVDEMDRFGPGDYQRLIEREAAGLEVPSVEQVLALLRFGRWDPRLVTRFADVLAAGVREGGRPAWLDRDLIDAVEKVRELHYPIAGQRDELPEVLGTLLFHLGRPGQAVACFEESLDGSAADAPVLVRLALAWLDLGERWEAIGALEHALQLQPGLAVADRLRRWIESGEGPRPDDAPRAAVARDPM